MKIPVRLVLTFFLFLIISVALLTKGDVKTRFKFVGFEFALETKDKAPITSKAIEAPPQPVQK
ncbi:MAG TPA: hypothetical protein VKM54_25765 [Myxococcota bacterium]|nr:hypothetical protein [Myxococcota bacterium]